MTRSTRLLGAKAGVGGALRGFVRGLFARVVAVWVIVFGIAAGAPDVARAEAVHSASFEVERADATIRVGKQVLRFEPAVADEAAALARMMPVYWSQLETSLGEVDDDLEVVFVDHAGQVAVATGMPRWVAGVARPSAGQIVIARHGPDGARSDLGELLKHEMAHVILHRLIGGSPIPAWLHEGVAESFTDVVSMARAQAMATAVFGPGVPELAVLERRLRSSEPAEVSAAYAAARDFVSYLRFADPHGSKLRHMLSELRQGYTLEAAVLRAYGEPLAALDTDWRRGLFGRFVWYPLVDGGAVFGLFFVPLVGLAYRRRRALRRAGLERLAREDLYLDQLAVLRAQLVGQRA